MNISENSINIISISYNLKDVQQLVWEKLVNDSVKKKNGFKTMCVGTIGKNAESILRIVVNRKVDEVSIFFFYTDIRSRKFSDLTIDNRVSLLFYAAKQSSQMIVKPKLRIRLRNES